MSEPLEMLLALPDQSLFGFPPTNNPTPIPPTHEPNSVMHPFNIPDNLFVSALDPKVPLSIALTYAVTIKLLNRFNKSRNKKPWSISKTTPFGVFVILHNIFLAVYSAWTFWGMLGGMRRSILSPMGPMGWAGTADSFCRLHGAPGPGNSVFYDEASSTFVSATQGAAMVDGFPDKSQAGRMWNEGLAYYGWIFYLSKFYEVLDTFIILAKGKQSSVLQTYHHAGAMLCMWAGMRFMSAPIWIFVLVNSFIHALMYTYYTLTAFNIRIPTIMKRTLTSMQITQFVLGGSYAMMHSFVYYVAPVTVTRETAAPTAGSAPAAESLAAGTFDSLKKLVFGGEGDGTQIPHGSLGASTTTETFYITQGCVATTGESFAIWLNVLYLAPLTYLFVSFFIASYVKRSNAAHKSNGKSSRRLSSNVVMAEKAGWDAAKSIEKEVYGGENMLNGSAIAEDSPQRSNGKGRRRA
ncbi:unnamed protein product [Clonostachys solani]|uniref:Elongation of fatty acids protein n=1 Tax=Clonostachys solani TaxID=160281 RepID=A0A9P0EHX9_9HYPO|nr:unnamed protein product [Clonostachys solani]